jgi:hypothetical protein
MPDQNAPGSIDISQLSDEQLAQIKSQVIRQLMVDVSQRRSAPMLAEFSRHSNVHSRDPGAVLSNTL